MITIVNFTPLSTRFYMPSLFSLHILRFPPPIYFSLIGGEAVRPRRLPFSGLGGRRSRPWKRRSMLCERRSVRFRLLIGTCDAPPRGVRADGLTQSKKKSRTSPLFRPDLSFISYERAFLCCGWKDCMGRVDGSAMPCLLGRAFLMLCWRLLPAQRAERPRDPGGVAAFMSAHSKTLYITPGMDISPGEGVVRGRRAQQLAFTLLLLQLREHAAAAAAEACTRGGSSRAAQPWFRPRTRLVCGCPTGRSARLFLSSTQSAVARARVWLGGERARAFGGCHAGCHASVWQCVLGCWGCWGVSVGLVW